MTSAVRQFLWLVVCLPLAIGCTFGQNATAPSIFVSAKGLDRVRARVASGLQPYRSANDTFLSVTSNYLNDAPNPFFMGDIRQIEFGWCSPADGVDDSLKDLVEKLETDSNKARSLAVAYLLTGDDRYASKAKEIALDWVQHSVLLNIYDLNVDFQNATFDGIEDGFCNRSWNMALDSVWQTYGLINFSDTYAILSRNGNVLSGDEDAQLRAWLREYLLAAVNAGFHAWTRWADAHPNSDSYPRYRSDNHLSWALAGIAAAAAALEDEELWNYVYSGGTYDDGHSGPYANPSSVTATIGHAISSDGSVYDQKVRANEHKGMYYAHFHIWALTLCAQIAEVAKDEDYFTRIGSSGGSIAYAFDHYARYGAGELPIPDPDETTNVAFFRFLYEMVIGNSWTDGSRDTLYRRAVLAGTRDQIIHQSIGPVSVLTGELPDPFAPADTALQPPAAPTGLTISP